MRHILATYLMLCVLSSCDYSNNEWEAETIDPIEEGAAEDVIPVNNHLFEFYYEKCSDKGRFIGADGVLIMQEYKQYPDAEYEEAFEWYVVGIPYCHEDLLFLHLQSFEEGKIGNYLVTITAEDSIAQFEKAGEGQEGHAQMIRIDESTIRVTVIGNDFEIRNYYLDRKDSRFETTEYREELGYPLATFKLKIGGKQRNLNLFHSNKWNSIDDQFDLYLGTEFYFRLPPHPSNKWNYNRFVGVEIADFNKDKLQDILIKSQVTLDAKADSVEEKVISAVYFQMSDYSFTNNPEIDEQLEEDMSPEEIHQIIKKYQSNSYETVQY